ncbi:EspG family protein [Mycolicibacterium rutilum]|uniref:EspG family protein n=1 Tax=Mycolicibacterium rutilum TaxID=370526 RepID=A0A1H6LCZ5_MYCRU|nr:ESX secretion-associated protein EspG [Mycolicibacterium rutilum]SEH82276.1 EspG family protein [Mycolicibacterium rutilum]
MTAVCAARFVVSDDELQVAAARIGVQSWPVVLDVRPRHSTESELLAASDVATHNLTERGLIEHGELAAELGSVLTALQRPPRELAMRLVTPDGIARVAVVRAGTRVVTACRVGTETTLEDLGAAPGPASTGVAVRALLRHLPAAVAAEIPPVGAPLDAFSEALSGTHDATELSDRIRALGAEPRAAMLLGSALASRQAFAEVVSYALDPEDDRITRSSAALGVFYTKRGRIVAAPSASPSNQLWTTFKPGSDHAIAQGVDQLIGLAGDRWEEC